MINFFKKYRLSISFIIILLILFDFYINMISVSDMVNDRLRLEFILLGIFQVSKESARNYYVLEYFIIDAALAVIYMESLKINNKYFKWLSLFFVGGLIFVVSYIILLLLGIVELDFGGMM